MRALALSVLFAAACGPPSSACPNDLPTSCPSTVPSYATDVSAIFTNYCVTCHSAAGVEASRPLDTYASVFNQRSSVLDQVYSCRMPQAPEPSLTAAERASLLAWLVCDAPQN